MKLEDQDIFFSIVRASIWQKPVDVDIPCGYDWTDVLQMCHDQALTGVVASCIMNLPEKKRPQRMEMVSALSSSFAMHVRMRDRMQSTIVKVFSLLEEKGIKAILMKGESMVRFYPATCQRGLGDIDVLVPQERYREAVSLLQELSGDMGHEDPMERHYKIEYNGFTLEIHQKPIWCANSMHKRAFQRLSRKYADPERCEWISLKGQQVRVFPMQYNVLFIFNHLLEHLRDGGVGLKQIVDWTASLPAHPRPTPASRPFPHRESASCGEPADGYSMEVLEKELRASGLLRAWKVMGGIVVRQLGLDRERMPFYDERMAQKSQGEILRRIVEGGLFGRKLHEKEKGDSSSRPVQVLKNVWFVIKDTRYLWTLFPDGALGSSWGIILNSLRHHAGVEKGNRVFKASPPALPRREGAPCGEKRREF